MIIQVPDIVPLPLDLGLDGKKFPSYRPNQPQAILEIVDCEKRFLLTSMPTGTGKSLTYIAASLLGGGKTLIFTANKGLQRQLVEDFTGLVAYVDGRANHKCTLNNLPCDAAPCSTGYKCPFRETEECDFWSMILKARKSNIVVTNYHFWLSNSNKNNRFILGHFDRIVCDEAHNSVKILLDTLSTTLNKNEFAGKWVEPNATVSECITWINKRLEETKEIIKHLNEECSRSARYDIIRFTKLRIKLENLSDNFDSSNWIIEHFGDSVRFDPVWPATLSEWYLFRGIKQVVMTSATVRPKVMTLLGVASQKYHYHEYDSIFPVNRRPIMIIPTVRMQYNMSRDEIDTWLTKIQQIIFRRTDRKGIIHTVSYARCKDILSIAKYRDIMMTHDSRNTEEVVKEFKKAKPPRILVSPSVGTGWDFPFDQCEYQIIGKVPFPDMRLAVDQERQKIDKEYRNWIAMQLLEQICGRGMRAPDDQCENFIPDGHATWFIFRNKHLATKSFMNAVQELNMLPDPPGRIEKKQRQP
jgi:Rad3-related DNA helicase